MNIGMVPPLHFMERVEGKVFQALSSKRRGGTVPINIGTVGEVC